MEGYCNRNSSNGRYCHNQMNQNCRQREMHMQDCRKMKSEENGRGVKVDCVCKVTTGKDCYKEDCMDKLGSRFPIAMAYVPWQQWGELYEPDCALQQGTLFKELNKIFCGVRC